MNEELAIFLRALMFLNSATLWLAGTRERYRPAIVASLVLLVGALGWNSGWSPLVLGAYWCGTAAVCFWLLRTGLRDYQRGRLR